VLFRSPEPEVHDTRSCLIPGLKGRECRIVNRNELPTHDTSSQWANSLRHVMNDVPDAQRP